MTNIEWNFSSTADWVVGFLLVAAMIAATLA